MAFLLGKTDQGRIYPEKEGAERETYPSLPLSPTLPHRREKLKAEIGKAEIVIETKALRYQAARAS